MQKIMTTEQLHGAFGEVPFKPNGSGGAIDILDGWADKNIVTVHIPALDGVSTGAGHFSGRVQLHRLVIEQVTRAFAEIAAQGLAAKIVSWDGSFVPRMMRSGRDVSRHTYGIAFDINAAFNPYEGRAMPYVQYGSVVPLVQIMDAYGIAWGGNWESPRDPMHFEVGRVIDYTHITDGGKLVIGNEWQQAIPITFRDGVSYASIGAMSALAGDTAQGEALTAVAPYLRGLGYTVSYNAQQKKVYARMPGTIQAPGGDNSAAPHSSPTPELQTGISADRAITEETEAETAAHEAGG